MVENHPTDDVSFTITARPEFMKTRVGQQPNVGTVGEIWSDGSWKVHSHGIDDRGAYTTWVRVIFGEPEPW